MPIYNDDEVQPKPKEDVIRAFEPSYQTAVIDTRYVPQSALLAYMAGRTWVVNYYSQVIDANDELKGQDVSLEAPLQQYRRIWSMELKVQNDLRTPSQDPNNNEMIAQGSANVYPFLTPQEGDMFTGSRLDGKLGLFKVTKVTMQQMATEAVASIEYQEINQNNPQWMYDLDNKVVYSYFFVKSFLLNEQNPLLTTEEYESSKQLEKFYFENIDLYFEMFFSREFMTLCVPAQDHPTYDHGLVDFVSAIMQSTDSTQISSLRQLNIGDDGAMRSPSLWKMILEGRPNLMKYVYKKTGLVGRLAFHSSGLMAGMRYTGISRIVYPYDYTRSVDYTMSKEIEKPMIPSNIVSKMIPLPTPIPENPGDPVPLVTIKPVNMAENYVFTSAFYERNIPQCSLLEKLTLNRIDGEPLDYRDILKLTTDSLNWEGVERFYYIPILICLIRYHLTTL